MPDRRRGIPRTSPAYHVRRGVVGLEPEPGRGITPHLEEVRPDGLDTGVVEPVDPTRPARRLDHESGGLQQLEMARHGRPADRQGVGDLANGSVACAEELDDRPAVGVAECVERVAGRCAPRHRVDGNRTVTVCRPRSTGWARRPVTPAAVFVAAGVAVDGDGSVAGVGAGTNVLSVDPIAPSGPSARAGLERDL